MAKKLSFSIAVNLLTENFKKGTNTVKNSLRSIQMQIITFAAALGASGLGLSGLLTRFRDVARETNRVITALKNVSNGTKGFADNLRFINDLANKYGLEVNALIGNFSKFTASATQANMPMEQQKKIFESLSRASAAFALSSEETDGVFLALSQMMGKGKISMEELRKQMGEKLPVAIQAMAKALGVSIGQMEKLIGSGKVMAADVLPKFADALNEMIPNVDTDNLETSISRLSNVFGDIVNASGFTEKYKALIDGFTELLKSASQNIQNIIVGIIAVFVFVVTNALTKVYRGYATTGQQIVANATTTHNKLRTAIAARVEAEIALEQAKLRHFMASGQKQVAAAREVERAKQTLSARTAAVNTAHENAKAAAAQAAAIRSRGAWATSYAAISGSAKRLMASLKSMWNTFAPAIIISAIVALIGHFRNVYNESKRIKNIFSDYKKEVENVKPGNEAIQLEKLRDIANDLNRSIKERQTALDALNRILNTNYTIDAKTLTVNGDINKKIAERIGLLKAQAKAEYLTTKLVNMEARRDELEKQKTDLEKEDKKSNVKGKAAIRFILGDDVAGSIGMDTAKKAQEEIDQINAVIKDANKQLEQAIIDGGLNNPTVTTPTSTPTDPDNKALRAAEKKLEALRKLDEEDRKRQIEKQKFDLELQQKAIDIVDDSFEKRTKQTLLNLEKEKLSIEEFQSDLLKKQTDYAKDKYVSVKGTDKGFEAYFADLKKNNFKNQNGISILPEGLRPEDIEKQVGELLSAAQNAQAKGLKDINKDLSLMLREQELMFASDLDKKMAELDAYYNEQLIKAGNNATLVAQIEKNRKRGKKNVKTDDNLKRLDFEEDLKLERVAGMESIGMTELVEEKKLEITKQYLQLRIDALKELADAGDEDAKRQMQLYEASLKKLDTQKPVKSLKSLADKAIFDVIKKGFEKAGDSAEEAEEKTTNLMGSISAKAGFIANIASELQSMFGGLDESLDMALETVGNIAQGFATGGIVGGAMAVIGEGMKLFSKASEAAARHQKALKEIEESRLASQRAYNLLLLEQNLLLKEAVSVFGEKQITRAANAIQNYRDSLSDLKGEMQGDFAPNEAYEKYLEKGASSGGIMKAYFGKQLQQYRNQVNNYNKGIAKLADQQIVTGHKKTGMFGWGKGKDTYSSILDVYPDVIDKEGKLNKERLQTIINTRKMSDETKAYLQNLLDLETQAEAAQEELRNYLQTTFGSLGDDIMTSLENAIKDKGVSAWESFGEAGAKVIEQLGKQIAYELFFADKFKKLQSDLEGVYGSNKSEADIAREAMDLVGNFYQNIGKDMELAQGFMENWQKEAEKYGLNLWQPESKTSQSVSSGGFQSMDQDTGNRLDGRFAALQLSGVKMEGLLSAISIGSNNIFNMTVSINSELQKHTNLFNEMKTIQLKSFYEIEGTAKSLKGISERLDKIDKNTSKL